MKTFIFLSQAGWTTSTAFSTWSVLLACNLQALQSILNAAACLLTRKPKYYPIAPWPIHWPPMGQRLSSLPLPSPLATPPLPSHLCTFSALQPLLIPLLFPSILSRSPSPIQLGDLEKAVSSKPVAAQLGRQTVFDAFSVENWTACADFPNVVAQRHIFVGAHPRELWPPSSNSAEIFVQCIYQPSFIILRLLVRTLSCWQTNKQTKQTPLKTSNALRYATMLGINLHKLSRRTPVSPPPQKKTPILM